MLDELFIKIEEQPEDQDEIWRTILGHEHYMISNKGRVKRIDNTHLRKYKDEIRSVHFKEKILKPIKVGGKDNRFGAVKLDGKTLTVHRLVAQHFIPNPANATHVVHKNNDYTDNSVENLEWKHIARGSFTLKHKPRYGIKERRKLKPLTTKQPRKNKENKNDNY